MKNYVSNLITETTIKTLDRGKNYLIGSEMGSGKNYWVRNVLLPFANKLDKRTLILSHRTATRDQQKLYLKEYEWEQIRNFRGGLFQLMTYQQFENKILNNELEYLNQFDFIVCDEAHYFTSDCTMNFKTDISFEYLKNNKTAIKLFLTATYKSFSYLNLKYTTLKEADYFNNLVENLWGYKDINSITPVLEERVINGEKVLILFDKINSGKEFILSTNENAKMLTSANKNTNKDYNSLVNNQTSNSNILCSTSLICEGVEIKDNNTKTIVLDGIIEIEKFIQSTGRVRDNKVDVYYKKPSYQKVINRYNKFNNLCDLIEEFEELGEIEYVKKYKIETIQKSQKFLKADTVIDHLSGQEYTSLSLHQCNVANIYYQRDMYQNIMENGFENVLKEYFPNSIFYDYQELLSQELIQNKILDDFIDKKLFKEQQQELKNLLTKEYGFKKNSLNSINNEFKKRNIGFKLESKINHVRDENRKKRYWVLYKLN